uniref:Uncharacterized protein n=1 Tax=Rhizophora mucronata TaxID=61149 RepID=A0A2P2NID0_RHIMU
MRFFPCILVSPKPCFTTDTPMLTHACKHGSYAFVAESQWVGILPSLCPSIFIGRKNLSLFGHLENEIKCFNTNE